MTVAPKALIKKPIHHHIGVLPSLNAVSLSVSQPRLCCGTGVMRRNSAGGASDSRDVDVSAINCFLSLPHEILRRTPCTLPCCKDADDNPASHGSDCEHAPNRSCAAWST